jgi:DNA-binding NarL/FixJ family response regulator
MTEHDKIRVFIIDDHKLFVEGMTALLANELELVIIGFSYSAEEFLPFLDQVKIDAFIIDINLPGISGIELTQKIKGAIPGAKILILSMYESYEYIENAIKSGASGYLHKAASHEELVRAIKSVAMGEQFFRREILKVLTRRIGSASWESGEENPPNVITKLLSKREIEILFLITQEHTTQQIAEQLFISERTVETHRKNILSKTGTKSIVGLIRYAIQKGLVSFDRN